MIVEQRIVRLPTILDTYSVSRAFVYKQMAKGLFPSQVHLGARSVGWIQSEVECAMQARFNGYSEDKLAKLVTHLHTERERVLDMHLSNQQSEKAA